MVEILVEMEAQAAADADGHVAVAREVEIDLEGEGHDAHPGTHGRKVLKPAPRQQLRRDLRELVGEDDFLTQSAQETHHPLGKVVAIDMPVGDLRGHRAVADDGTGNQLREHGDVEQQVLEAALHWRSATIDIYQI